MADDDLLDGSDLPWDFLSGQTERTAPDLPPVERRASSHDALASDETPADRRRTLEAAMSAPTCGCEPLWPNGIDTTSCYWHSGDRAADQATPDYEDRRAS